MRVQEKELTQKHLMFLGERSDQREPYPHDVEEIPIDVVGRPLVQTEMGDVGDEEEHGRSQLEISSFFIFDD